jgi:glutamate-1-semialdehyde aminotransferase
VEVAEALTQLIPCAEQVRFLRTGAEATSAAVRIARTWTGRERVVASGYFGWHDWSSDAAGVPVAVRAGTTWVPFDDLAALDAACDPGLEPPAAIIIEPLVHQIASAEWLLAARRLADRIGAVLIFDEVKTAFRVRTGGVQEALGIVPDLTTLGKAMANGYPVAAVVGRRAVMEAVRRSWVSSTAASEATGLAAVQAVIARHRAGDVCARMAAAGGALQAVVALALEAVPEAGIRAEGPPMMWRLESRTPLALDALVAAAAHHGVLLKRGAYQFGATAHDEKAVAAVQEAMSAVVEALRRVFTSHTETGS